MFITNAVTFTGGSKPETFAPHSRSLMRPDRVRQICSICNEISPIGHAMRSTASHYGKVYDVCGRCNKRYYDAPGQIERFGLRFRFVKKSEIPYTGRAAKHIYKILLLFRERQEIRQKEVNWMADEKAEKLLKLPSRIAAVVGQTYAVCGDDFKLADDEALMRIRDLLDDIDPAIMQRVRKKKRAS